MIDWTKPLRTRHQHHPAELLATGFSHNKTNRRGHTNVVLISFPHGDEIHFFDDRGQSFEMHEDNYLDVENEAHTHSFQISMDGDTPTTIEADSAHEALETFFNTPHAPFTELVIRQL